MLVVVPLSTLCKENKKEKEKRQWETGSSHRPPISLDHSQSFHVGWPPVCSFIGLYQVLLKSVQWFCRCEWLKIALYHYFGHWLVQQLELLCKPLLYMLRAINRSALSIDRAAPSRDLLLAQASTDGATIDGSRCAIDG